MEPPLLFIQLVKIWEGAIDGYIRTRPEEGSCLQFVTHGCEPDLKGGQSVFTIVYYLFFTYYNYSTYRI